MKLFDIIKATKGYVINQKFKNKEFNKVVIDSRLVNKNDVFIAIKGKHFDGHNYIKDIIKKKPCAIIISENIDINTNIPIIKVDDTHKCLMDIGSYCRNKFNGSIIAVTGSVGKTTTKELISLILSKKYKVLKSEGNKNNHIGVPLTLTQLNNQYDVAVLELGMNHKNEISNLSKLVKPNISIITNIGTAHIGNLGSKKNIFKAKMEIIDGMDSGNLILNNDDKYLKKVDNFDKIQITKCGIKNCDDMIIDEIKCDIFKTQFCILFNNKKYKFILNIPGIHLIKNCLIAIKIGQIYNISFEDMIDAVKEYKPLNNRLNISCYGNNILIDDCYNSNYESVLGLINYIKDIKKEKIIVLGDILELGKYSKKVHIKIGKVLNKYKFRNLIFVGEYMYYAHKKNSGSIYFKNNDELINYLNNNNINNSLILVKGSRGMHLEEIVLFLNNKLKK